MSRSDAVSDLRRATFVAAAEEARLRWLGRPHGAPLADRIAVGRILNDD